MTDLPIVTTDLPKWVVGKSIIPPFPLDFGQNPINDFLSDIKVKINVAGDKILEANDGKKKAILAAQNFLNKFNQDKNTIRDEVINSVESFGVDLTSTGGHFIIPNLFYGGLNSIRENSVKVLSSNFSGVPMFGENTWVSSFTFVVNLGNDFINASKTIITLLNLINSTVPSTKQTISDMINSPLLSPLASMINLSEMIKPPPGWDGSVQSVRNNFSEAWAATDLFFQGLTDENGLAGDVKQFWDESVFKDIASDIDYPDPTGNITSFGTLLSELKESAGKPLNLSFSSVPDPFNSLVLRQSEKVEDWQKKPYENWFKLITVGDLFPGVVDVTKFASGLTNEVSKVLDFSTNGIANGLQFVDSVTDFGAGFVQEGMDKSNELLDGIKQDLSLLNFDLFIVPPTYGGLEQLRFVHSEWIPVAENAPDFSADSLTLMVMVVFGLPDNSISGLTTLGKLFNIDVL